jgi:hypothetical protein
VKLLRSLFARVMDGVADGEDWARAVALVATTLVAVLLVYIATGIVWVDPFDAL